MTIAAIAAGLVLASGTFGGSSGTLGPSSGTLGSHPKPASSPTYRAPSYGAPSASRPRAPSAPVAPKPPSMDRADGGGFKPYKGQSTYSDRGGVNAYPGAAKPKGYINPYGR